MNHGPCGLKDAEAERMVRDALDEDIGAGDATSLSLISADAWLTARIVTRQPLVLAGCALAEMAFAILDPKIVCEPQTIDASQLEAGVNVISIHGPARAILSAERVALNFLQRLSGVATLTSKYVAAVAGTGACILDTRKTTPGWRRLEKYAVRCGGGTNHRMGLYDMILIKDNHLAALHGSRPNAIAGAVSRARAAYPSLRVEVEADTLEQVNQAVEAGADIILLDNMTLDQLRESTALVAGRAECEASGGVNLDTVRAIAETGVRHISVGALTHSAPVADLALDADFT